MLASHFYIIRQGIKNYGVRTPDHSYVIGFKNVIHARHVYYNMHPEMEPSVVRNKTMNIGSEVQQGLVEFGIYKQRSNILIDINSKLVFKKANRSNHASMNDGGFHLFTMPAEEFISLPMSKQVGIIIPSDFDEDNDDEIVMLADIVEPFIDYEVFRQSLKL